MAKKKPSKHDAQVEKVSGKGKTVLVDGEMVPIENLKGAPERETPEQAEKRRESAKAELEEESEEADYVVDTSKSKRDLHETKRVKGLKLLRKNKKHFDPNWNWEQTLEACIEAKLMNEKGKLTELAKADDGEDDLPPSPQEAKYRSDLMAKMMDEDVDFDHNLDTEDLEEIWEQHVEGLDNDETDRERYIRILKACDYELEEDMTDEELKEELESFRAELIVVAQSLEVEFKGKEIDVLYQEVLKAKDEKDDSEDENDENGEESNGGDDTPEPTPPAPAPNPVKKTKKKTGKKASGKKTGKALTVVQEARKEDLIERINTKAGKKVVNKTWGLEKLETKWKEVKTAL